VEIPDPFSLAHRPEMPTGCVEKGQSMSEGIPGGQFSEPVDVVHAILFLASDAARFITGVDLIVDGGYVV
jgi:NAD(P)-dependent dehydrogenase (short-subunit alcohol dehydrogenase family)